MHTFIYTLEKTLYEGITRMVTLPTTDGEISVLQNHMPIVTSLKPGMVKVSTAAEKKEVPIGGGFAYIDGTNLVVLADN